ncbi:nitrous oxide reductase accessory protein NosL [Colwellia psychrerythraea]|nr:nitrous oxide reductase accessory protein NosL [Colwellia psychrerythraea]
MVEIKQGDYWGKTLASFSLQNDAQAFATEFGGKVLSFSEVNQDSLW